MEVRTYRLKPTALVPNSPQPLLHYPALFAGADARHPAALYDLMQGNGWDVQWIFRYGATQPSHYHSRAHECMVVLCGSATIRFGVADADAAADGSVELSAKAGDVFVLPAGTAHKTMDAQPADEFVLLSPGDGHGIPGDDPRGALEAVELSGFAMIGGYPSGSQWDFAVGGEHAGGYEEIWGVPKPERDPVLGADSQGLCGLWT